MSISASRGQVGGCGGSCEGIGEGNAQLPPQGATWARLAKITEEAGEVVTAHIGATGQNPRKGVTHTRADVEEELLDVALTALAALEHLRGHDARSLDLLAARLEATDRKITRLNSSHV